MNPRCPLQVTSFKLVLSNALLLGCTTALHGVLMAQHSDDGAASSAGTTVGAVAAHGPQLLGL